MNQLQVIMYVIYVLITFYITIYVGLDLNRKGAVFLMEAFDQKAHLVIVLNRFLLTGYYLVNLGYASVSISTFNTIYSWIQLVEQVSFRTGVLVILLGVLHYFNLYAARHFTRFIQDHFSNQ